MGQLETILVFTILLCAVSHKVFEQQTIAIDTADDIPNDGRFEVDCPNGYANYSTEFDCGEFGGAINIPPVSLKGEIGFWAKCGRTCVIRYHAKPEDFHFKIRVYQTGTQITAVRIGDALHFAMGQGWVMFSRNLNLSKDTVSCHSFCMD